MMHVLRPCGNGIGRHLRGLTVSSQAVGRRFRLGKIGSVATIGELPECVQTKEERRMLLRRPDVALQKYVMGVNEYNKGLVLLSGVRGSGKSTSLRAAVSFARSEGCVCLYIPDAYVWTRGGGFFAAVRGEEGSKDDTLPVKWYERPRQMGEVLEILDKCHGKQIEEVKCGEYGSVRDAVGQALSFLGSLEDDWRLYPRRAGALFEAILTALASDESVRFMLAVDGYEAFTGLTELGARGRYVHSNAIPLVGKYLGRNAVEQYSKSIRNGLVVLACGAACEGRTIRRSRVQGTTEYQVDDEIRADCNGSKFRAELFTSPSRTGAGVDTAEYGLVEYKKFSQDELKRLYRVMAGTKVISTSEGKERTEEGKLLTRVSLLSGGRGDEFRRLSDRM